MYKKKVIIVSLIGLALIAAIVFAITYNWSGKKEKINPAFAKYISAFSSGMISSESSIKIRLANEIASPDDIGQAIDAKLFSFSPSIKGVTTWKDSRTIEFKPSEPLKSGEKYTASFKLGKLMQVSSELQEFDFKFMVIPQSYSVTVDNIKAYDKQDYSYQKLLGTLITADVANNDDVEKMLNATQKGKNLSVKWEHQSDRKTHTFRVDSIIRSNNPETVTLKFEGKPIGIKLSDSKDIEIPALNDFKVVNAKVMNNPEQYVLVQFSDPLQDRMNLDGLITIGNQSGLSFSVLDNELSIFLTSQQKGEMQLNVDANIKNTKGVELKKNYSQTLVFEELKPAVRLVGKGVILPNSNGLIFPFEAVNLRAVDVKIIKIFENNIAQFLQVNALDGERELTRVGKTVLKKKISLLDPTITDYGMWNRFSLDLSTLIKTEPGAIYKVTLGFKQKYAIYKCDEEISDEDAEMEEVSSTGEDEEEETYYGYGYDDYYGDYYGDYYYDDYNWADRDNPCKSSYYGERRNVSRNVLASDLGLIAKKGSDGSLQFIVTDLITAKPLSGVTVEVYDYQQQLIKKAETDGDGIANIELIKRPFLLIAKKGNQRGYLKLDDGSSLSLSMFDVSGDYVNKGLKGYIYGERGIWRPGDTLFLMFILEDKNKTLPENHPVSFELQNPQGQIVKRMVASTATDGFYRFTTPTDADAPTGSYLARISVGGVTFTKYLKIETIMPNRLKVALTFNADRLTKDSKDDRCKLQVKWLHGSAAKKLRTNVAVTLNQSTTKFKNYEDYTFDDPSKTFYAHEQVVFDDRLDDEGNAEFKPSISIGESAPGVLKANFVTRVFEEGGSFSTDRTSILYYPYTSFVGIMAPKGAKNSGMLFTDTNNIIQIANLTADGKPIASNEVTVEVYKVGWRWWWDNSYESLSSYVSSWYNKPIKKEKLNINNGKAAYTLRISYPEWGRYLVRVTDKKSGHSTGKVLYIDWPNWASRVSDEKGSAATMLTFTADKAKYKVGETVKLTIPSPEKGRALISIETGSKVLQSHWAEVTKGDKIFEFKVTEEMAPNVYAHVTLIQPHAQTANDLPIRLYGVIPIEIDDPNTHLRPVINMPAVLKPEETATISISEENGKAMSYTIAMVDEGLLDITKFETPDPWKHFYAREALGVKTWDIFDYVMGAYGGQLERILSIGGGDEGRDEEKQGSKANRFKPMVKFIGPFTLKKGQTATHKIEIPQYIGSVRTMVIAAKDGAYGSADKTTPVRKPLMVLGTLPRVIGPGEKVQLPVNVFALENHVKNVQINIKTNGLFSIDGTSSKTLNFKKVGDEMVYFDLQAKMATGVGKVDILATSGSEKATYSIEIDVRNPNPKMTSVIDAVIQPGQQWKTTFEAIGMQGTNTAVLELSNIPPLNLSKRVRYLLDYPHGCVEQTTSAVFPQLYLADLMDLSKETKSRIETHVKAAIKRLKTFQTNTGGFAYWPGNYAADEWGTNYAGHFLLEAEAKGYHVPSGMLESWKKYQKQMALSWTGTKNIYYNNELVQAYRLYTLALAKAPELGAMNSMRERKDLSVEAKWRLAAAYQIAGQPEAAKNLVANISYSVKDYNEMSYTYGSGDRDRAMILEALSLMNMKTKAAPIFKEIQTALSAENWMSTQTTAYCLLAVTKFLGKAENSQEINCSFTINNDAAVPVNTAMAVSEREIKIKETASNKIEIKNSSKGMLYVRLILQGVPAPGEETASENNLRMNVVFKSMKGDIINPEKLEQGTDFMAEVSLTNPGILGAYKEMALTQIFPSGWEIRNTRLDDFNSSIRSSSSNYQDYRDDRVYTYFHLNSNESKTYRIILNAAYVGRFYLPAFYCEAMYNASVNARSAGKWVEVTTYSK